MQTGAEEGVEWCGSIEMCTKNIIRIVVNAVAARVRVLIFSLSPWGHFPLSA